MENRLPIYEDKNSEKIVAFAYEGYDMSKRWWKETHRLHEQGLLWGVHIVPSGLRRIVI